VSTGMDLVAKTARPAEGVGRTSNRDEEAAPAGGKFEASIGEVGGDVDVEVMRAEAGDDEWLSVVSIGSGIRVQLRTSFELLYVSLEERPRLCL
jgi:hypothetical protein